MTDDENPWHTSAVDISERDLGHLRRCIELAEEALEDGDEPFGSVLVDATSSVRFEDRNRVKDGDETRHPEFEIARWWRLLSVPSSVSSIHPSTCATCHQHRSARS
jgi:hypothetical protein